MADLFAAHVARGDEAKFALYRVDQLILRGDVTLLKSMQQNGDVFRSSHALGLTPGTESSEYTTEPGGGPRRFAIL